MHKTLIYTIEYSIYQRKDEISDYTSYYRLFNTDVTDWIERGQIHTTPIQHQDIITHALDSPPGELSKGFIYRLAAGRKRVCVQEVKQVFWSHKFEPIDESVSWIYWVARDYHVTGFSDGRVRRRTELASPITHCKSS